MKKNTLDKKNAVIYCRVATTQQATPAGSIAAQEADCRNYARTKGYKVERVFTDVAAGSDNYKQRPGIIALLNHINENKDKSYVVILDDLSRLTRDVMAYQELVKKLADQKVVIVCSRISSEISPIDEFMENIMASVAQFEHKCRSRNVIRGIHAKKQSTN